MGRGAGGSPWAPGHTGGAGWVAAAALLGYTFYAGGYLVTVLWFAALYAIFVTGLNFFMGYTGQVSLGHAAFFGFGAYVSALVLKQVTPSFWLALAVVLVSTTLVGLAFGPYLVGLISDLTGSMVDGKPVGDLRTGILSLVGVAPIALTLLIFAYRAVPQAEATLVQRAGESG